MFQPKNMFFSLCFVCTFSLVSSCAPVIQPTETTHQTKTPKITEPINTPAPTSTQTAASPVPTKTKSAALGVNWDQLQGTTLDVWLVWNEQEGDTIQKIVDNFNNNNGFGINTEITVFDDYFDIYQSVNDALVSDNMPNLAVGYNNQYLEWNSIENRVVDLNTYITDESVGFQENEITDFYSAFWEQNLIDERLLGITLQGSGQFIFYNTTWAKELGFMNPPTTPNEFMEQACAATEANLMDDHPENDGMGGWFINTNASAITAWIYAFGGEIEKPGSGYHFNSPEVIEAFTFLRELYNRGCAWQSATFFPNLEFASRQGLFYTSSIAGIPNQKAAFEAVGSNDEWNILPFPSTSGTPVINVYGPSMVIFSSTPEKQLASWLFIKHFTEAQNQASWINKSGHLPTRTSTSKYLTTYIAGNPLWTQSLNYLDYGKFEPRFASWSSVRGALQDASTQLFQDGFAVDDIPTLLEQLDTIAAELFAETH